MWGGSGPSEGLFPTWMRQTLGPALLILSTFPFAFTMVYTNTTVGTTHGLNGSLSALAGRIWDTRGGFVAEAFHATWPTGDRAVAVAQMLGAFVLFQLVLVRAIPGPEYRGPVSPRGAVPVYTVNGLYSYLAAVAAFLLATVSPWRVVSAATIMDLYPSMLCVMSVGSLVFCAALFAKGVWAPSGPDSDSAGNPILDYYAGRELYPRVLGWDVKQMTNCRFGMMAWGLLPIAFAAATYEAKGIVSTAQMVNVALNIVYVAKFFDWEHGYFSTMDIMHDKAGYYICWGCLVWVPSVYVVHSYYIAQQVMAGTDYQLPMWGAAVLLVVGVAAVYVNYDADLQRTFARETDGKAPIWGAAPRVIRAKYTVEGVEKPSLLLASGWWGIARHFHYVPEILAAWCWSLPAGFNHIMPYFYVLFLMVLLTDRAYRDDARCFAKYGKYWTEYRKAVPYKIIPGVL